MKEELDKIEEGLRRLKELADSMQSHDVAMLTMERLNNLRPDIEEGLRLLAIKRLQDSADDGNAGFITPKER